LRWLEKTKIFTIFTIGHHVHHSLHHHTTNNNADNFNQLYPATNQPVDQQPVTNEQTQVQA